MIFDPIVLPIENLMRQYYSMTVASRSMVGQYRSQIFPASEEQAEAIRSLANGSNVPLAEPGSPEAVFWPAEAYHQKYRLRRNATLVSTMTEVLGPRWDEHAYATKLNAAGERGFDLKPWLTEMPGVITAAFE